MTIWPSLLRIFGLPRVTFDDATIGETVHLANQATGWCLNARGRFNDFVSLPRGYPVTIVEKSDKYRRVRIDVPGEPNVWTYPKELTRIPVQPWLARLGASREPYIIRG